MQLRGLYTTYNGIEADKKGGSIGPLYPPVKAHRGFNIIAVESEQEHRRKA